MEDIGEVCNHETIELNKHRIKRREKGAQKGTSKREVVPPMGTQCETFITVTPSLGKGQWIAHSASKAPLETV